MHGLSTGRTTNVVAFEPRDTPQSVWASGGVRVSAIRSTSPVMRPTARIRPQVAWSSPVTPVTTNPRLHATTRPLIKLQNWPRVTLPSITLPSIHHGNRQAKRLSSARVLPARVPPQTSALWRSGPASSTSCFAFHCTTWGRPVGTLQVACGIDGRGGWLPGKHYRRKRPCEPASAAQMMRNAACRIIAGMGRCTLAVVRSVKRGASALLATGHGQSDDAREGRRAQIRPPRQTDDNGTG
jgi:hypothetical protein